MANMEKRTRIILLAATLCRVCAGVAGQSFTMSVSPAFLNGKFVWTNSCCPVVGSGLTFTYSCDGNCRCTGCAATGYYEYEGYRLPATSGACGCGASGGYPPSEDDDREPSPLLPGAAATFSKRVIFFEDEYDNAPGETVPWRSTETVLDCRASGGVHGGRPLPFERELEPGEIVEFKNTYRAARPSGGADDIVATATFEENVTGLTWTSESKATAVKVEVEPIVGREGAPNRHLLGVREEVLLHVYPNGIGKAIETDGDWEFKYGDKFQCPLTGTRKGLVLKIGGLSYEPDLCVIEPQGLLCERGWTLPFVHQHSGVAGWVGMRLDLTIAPQTVSFIGLACVEEICYIGHRSGYFNDPKFESSHSHTKGNGAGDWHDISPDNHFFYDKPRLEGECPEPWPNGEIIWAIPIAWGERGSRETVNIIDRLPTDYQQKLTRSAASASTSSTCGYDECRIVGLVTRPESLTWLNENGKAF